ncbi:MAG: lysophospholipase [Candidatus Omnitrophota bacterium]
MQHTEVLFKDVDGLSLFEQRWQPDGDIKAAIVIVHGFAEHSNRYIHVAECLTRRGYAVYAFDLPGHGRSEGPRALVSSFNNYLSCLARFLDRVSKRESGRPVFLLGHSMGGTIAVLLAITQDLSVRGLILSGPLLKASEKIAAPVMFFISVAGALFPSLPVLKEINSNKVSSDPGVAKRYNDDPLVYHGKLLAGEAREINRAIGRIQKKMEGISLPLLILHGTGDRLVDIEGSRQLYARAGSSDKTIKLYKGFYHEILNEPGKDKVLSDVITWLDTHTRSEKGV